MTKLIFVHGMNNQDKSSKKIKDVWSGALNKTLDSINLPSVQSSNIEAAYFGDLLHDMAKSRSQESEEQELEKFADLLNNEFALYENEDTGELSYLISRADEIVLPGATSGSVVGERFVPRGNMGKRIGHTRVAITAAHLIKSTFPGVPKVVLSSFMKQAGGYLNDETIFNDVNSTVEEQVFQDMSEDSIIISHSLGTAIAYHLLRTGLGKGKVKALYTIGSPLGIDFFVKGLKERSNELVFPEGLPKWYNCWDTRDFVTLNRPIDESTIGIKGVTNINTFDTSKEDKHAIVSYLSHEFLARLIYSDLHS